MPEIKAGVVRVTTPDLAGALTMSIGGHAVIDTTEVLKSFTIDRRRNPPVLVVNTDRGKGRAEVTFRDLGRRIHLPPMHDIVDMWTEYPQRDAICFKVAGGQLPTVMHGSPVPDVRLVVTEEPARPGQPAYIKSRFERE